MPREYSLTEVVQAGMDSLARRSWHSLPGIVQTYDATTQTATIEPAVQNPVPILEDDGGGFTYETLPILPDVPIIFPGSAKFRIAFPLEPGDTVMLLFSSIGMSEFRINNIVGQPVDLRRHSLGAPVAYPCSIPDALLMQDAAIAGATPVVGLDNDPAQITFTPGTVAVGKGATDFVALASKVATELGAIVTAFNGHVHNVASFGASPPPTVLAGTPGSVAATIAKAK